MKNPFSQRIVALIGFFGMLLIFILFYVMNILQTRQSDHDLTIWIHNNQNPPAFDGSWHNNIIDETKLTKNRIQFEKARSLGDENQCSTIPDELLQKQCMNVIVAWKIGNSDDVTLCDLYKDAQEKDRCKNDMWLRLAISQGAAKYCRNIGDESMRENCILRIGNIHAEQGDTRACQDDDIWCQSVAKRAQMIQKRNIEWCWDPWGWEFQGCVRDVIIGILKKDGNSDYCKTIKEKESIPSLLCQEQSLRITYNTNLKSLLREAVKTQNIHLCEGDPILSTDCIARYKSIETILSP